MRMAETCSTVFKRQAINLRDWCIWLVDLFEYMMTYGLTNPEFINAKQAGDTYAYRNIKRKLDKTISAIWFNKICRATLLPPRSNGKPEATTAVDKLLMMRLRMWGIPHNRTNHDQQHCYHHVPTVNQRLLLQLISSWWWAWCPKHVELYLTLKSLN